MKSFTNFINENYLEEREEREKDDNEFMLGEVIPKIKSFIKSNKFIRNNDYNEHRLTSLLFHNKLNNIFNKKAFKIFHKKPFFRKESDGVYTSFIVAFTKKDYYIFSIILYEMSTSRGKIYFQMADDGKCFIFLSHFFDRYRERIFNIKYGIQRLEIIKELLNSIVLHVVNEEPIGLKTLDGKTFISKFPKGAALGEIYFDNYLLCKTFITDEQLKNNQIKDIKDYLDFVNTEKQNEPDTARTRILK